jgi:hypothetical protein
MDQPLELQNNQIIFKRAETVLISRYGLMNENTHNKLRDRYLKPSWRIEAEHFIMKRKLLGLPQSKVAEDINISLADLKKLEYGADFANRDIIAEVLKEYLQITSI